jgi:hypothetical protein
MNLSNRILLAAGMSWTFSVTLGLLFAANANGRFSLSTLRLPGVVPVALIVSTVISITLMPLAVWSVRTGAKNLYVCAPILWIALAAYVVLVIPKVGRYGPLGLILMAVVGLVILGFLPTSN